MNTKPKTIHFQNVIGVFQGGGCRGIAFVGAYKEALSRGVQFSEVAGTSAGSIVASLIAAGATSDQITNFMKEFEYNQLTQRLPSLTITKPFLMMTPARLLGSFWRNRGVFSSEYIQDYVGKCLSEVLGKPDVKFSDLPYPLHIVAGDLRSGGPYVWSDEETPSASVAEAVRSSCSVPFYFPPMQDAYVDGGVVSNLPTFPFAGKTIGAARRILAFTLSSSHATRNDLTDTFGYIKALAETIVDGAQQIQASLLTTSELNIDCGSVDPFDFKGMTPEVAESLLVSGASAASRFFDNEMINIKDVKYSGASISTRDEVYAAFIEGCRNAKKIKIIDKDTKFVWDIFPSLARWIMDGVEVSATLPSPKGASELFRRNTLRALGVEVNEIPFSADINAYISVGTDQDASVAIVNQTEKLGSKEPEATQYIGRRDAVVIKALLEAYELRREGGTMLPAMVENTAIYSASGEFPELERRLRSVRQYEKAEICMADVPFSKLSSLTKSVHEFKYRQIPGLLKMYADAKVNPFDPLVVNLRNGGATIVTPPVVEKVGDNFVLLEGSTRATYMYKNGYTSLRCVLVTNVVEALPARDIIPIGNVRIKYSAGRGGERYSEFDYGRFRKIEESVHQAGDVDD